jgi:hypothetical protein
MAFKNFLTSIDVECPGCASTLVAEANQEDDDQIFYVTECRRCGLSVSVCVESKDERS